MSDGSVLIDSAYQIVDETGIVAPSHYAMLNGLMPANRSY